MRALIVVESIYGNTRAVADAIAAGLATGMQVDVVDVEQAPKDPETDLLVIGGPTHAHGMSRSSTRKGRVGIREWIDSLDPVRTGWAATFDTRFPRPGWLVGSAAGGAARHLRRKGFHLAAAAESFYVTDAKGPLVDGELAHARMWGEEMQHQLVGKGHVRAA
ncbi:MAG TPA: flavodoxin domain-containing protein [Actinomycetota bacterium]|nr:flavodoxin domain-containing protein [Actinomycetota bacterium]